MKLLLQGRYATGSPPNLGNLPLVNFTTSFVLSWDCIPGPGQAQVEGGSHVAALRFIWAGVVCQPKRGGPTPRGRRCRRPERDHCRLCCPKKLWEAKCLPSSRPVSIGGALCCRPPCSSSPPLCLTLPLFPVQRFDCTPHTCGHPCSGRRLVCPTGSCQGGGHGRAGGGGVGGC